MEVDGKLVQECKQSEFNPVCFRKAQENRPERRVDVHQPPVSPVAKTEVKDGVQS